MNFDYFYLITHSLLRKFLSLLLFVLSVSFTINVFAQSKTVTETVLPEAVSSGTGTTGTGTEDMNETENKNILSEEEAKDKESEREKTINDINTFLIESYKIKIDRILANLNLSIERVTNNDPEAQMKLLEKIRGDVSMKIQTINSRNISKNRKKILSSVFSYIQENLDANISRLVQKK